ncbi:hypothetical protein H4Q26_001392 [Puccinia striiformis f. sp. tritici PST-130]|nr:hypothetical protein H4Q26_001392 [Puccinia striiformis f. sp. tritici PST-130]
MAEAGEVESIDDTRLRHMSKDDQALAKLGYKSECSVMCMTIAVSVAELVSAFPTSGGLYSASAFLVPKRFKAPVGFLVGWLSILGQIAAVASAEFALSQMIWSAHTISQGGNQSATKLQIVGTFGVLLIIHGLMNSVATSIMAKLTRGFIFFNLGATLTIISALLLSGPPRQSFDYVFTRSSIGLVGIQRL